MTWRQSLTYAMFVVLFSGAALFAFPFEVRRSFKSFKSYKRGYLDGLDVIKDWVKKGCPKLQEDES